MIIAFNGYAGSGKDSCGLMAQYLLCRKWDEKKLDRKPSIEEVIDNSQYHTWWLEHESGWQINKFAKKLKQIAGIILGVNPDNFEDDAFKDSYLPAEWDKTMLYPGEEDMTKEHMTVREFLQKLGTDALRVGLHENTWINAALADYKCTPSGGYPEYGTTATGERIPIGYNQFLDCPNWIVTDLRFPNEAQAVKDRGGIVIRVDRPGVGPKNNHTSETALDNWKFDYKIANVSDLTSLMFTVETILKHAKIL